MRRGVHLLIAIACAACDGLGGLDPLDGGPDPLRDAGLSVGEDAGSSDAGPVDAGTPDGGPPCEWPPYDEEPFEPDGTEDYVDPFPAEFPDIDVVATWSRMEGESLVVEVRFRAPIWRASRAGGLRIMFDRWPDEDVSIDLRTCQFLVPTDPDASGCIRFLSTAAVGPSGLPGGFGMPEFYALRSERGLNEVRTACDAVFVTPNGPYARLVVPLADLVVDDPSRYDFHSTYARIVDEDWEANWYGGAPSIESRGGAAPVEEDFVSVCAVTCGAAGAD